MEEYETNELFGLAKLHKDFDPRLQNIIKSQDHAAVRNCATKEARRLYGMHRDVMRCIHLQRGFIRFDRSAHGILSAEPRLEHDVQDILLQLFHKRFPRFYIILGHRGKSHVINPEGTITSSTASVKTSIASLERRLPINPLLKDIAMDEPVWDTYYESQYISQRRDIGLMKKMMPLKFRSKAAEETRISKRSASLDKWIE